MYDVEAQVLQAEGTAVPSVASSLYSQGCDTVGNTLLPGTFHNETKSVGMLMCDCAMPHILGNSLYNAFFQFCLSTPFPTFFSSPCVLDNSIVAKRSL